MEHPLLQITLEEHEVSALELAFESFDVESKLVIDLGAQVQDCGASRELALALEDINPGAIDKRYPVISFTQVPSQTNYEVAIEGVMATSAKILKQIGEAILKFIKNVFKAVADLFKDLFKTSVDVEKVEESNQESAKDFTDLVQGADITGSPIVEKVFKGEKDVQQVRVRAERVNGRIKFYNPASGDIKFNESGDRKVDKTTDELLQEGVDHIVDTLNGLIIYLHNNPLDHNGLEETGKGMGELGEEVNRIFFHLTLLQEKVAEDRNNNTLTMSITKIKELNKPFSVDFLMPLFQPADFTPTSGTIREDMTRLLQVYRDLAAQKFKSSGDLSKDKELQGLMRGRVNIFGRLMQGMEAQVKVMSKLDNDIKKLKFPPALNPKVDFAPSLVSEYHASARELYNHLNEMSSILLSAANIIGMILTSHKAIVMARAKYESTRVDAYAAMSDYQFSKDV